MRAEIQGQFADRDELLQEATKSNKDFGPANWYQGMTLDKKGQWHEIPEVVDAASNNQLLAEYEKLSSNLNDNVPDNWMLATWGATNQLNFQFRAHLEKVLKLNPKHQGARRGGPSNDQLTFIPKQIVGTTSTKEITKTTENISCSWQKQAKHGGYFLGLRLNKPKRADIFLSFGVLPMWGVFLFQ